MILNANVPLVHSIEKNQAGLAEGVVRTVSKFPNGSLLTLDFDRRAGGLMTRAVSTSARGEQGNIYEVIESKRIGEGFIPKTAHLIFANGTESEFPKQVIRFEITKMKDEIDESRFGITIGEKASYQVFSTDSPAFFTHLTAGDKITISDLGRLYQRALDKQPWSKPGEVDKSQFD